MNQTEKKKTKNHTEFKRNVGESEMRKIKAQKDKRSIWHGFGMFGLIGWSIVVPTVMGALLGIWLDSRYPSKYSYTLSLMIAGLFLGCFNAWHWIRREMKDMDQDENTENDEK